MKRRKHENKKDETPETLTINDSYSLKSHYSIYSQHCLATHLMALTIPASTTLVDADDFNEGLGHDFLGEEKWYETAEILLLKQNFAENPMVRSKFT